MQMIPLALIGSEDITELRSESKMLANYVRICGAAVWSLKGNAKTGVITEHLPAFVGMLFLCLAF